MFVTFFQELKQAGVPVTLREYLTLMQAMDADLASRKVEDFYFLSRAALVKDERNLDKFDRVFGHVFKGLETLDDVVEADIPSEWLKKLAEKYLTEEEKKQIEAMGGLDKLLDTLRKRLAEQKRRHQGGSKWIGTAGTSPYGAYGYNPEGVRIGQDGNRNFRAVKVWDKREFKDLDDEVELGTRNIKLALRRLRKFARTGAPEELDLDGTIKGTAHKGYLDILMRPERHNAVKVLLFFDIGGSMDWHIKSTEELFSAARSEFKHMEYFYFHNCLYERVWKENRRRFQATTPTWDVLHTYPHDYKVIFVGDASMSPYEIAAPGGSVEHYNDEPGSVWLERVARTYPAFVWLNPVPEKEWALYPFDRHGSPTHGRTHVPTHPGRAGSSDPRAWPLRQCEATSSSYLPEVAVYAAFAGRSRAGSSGAACSRCRAIASRISRAKSFRAVSSAPSTTEHCICSRRREAPSSSILCSATCFSAPRAPSNAAICSLRAAIVSSARVRAASLAVKARVRAALRSIKVARAWSTSLNSDSRWMRSFSRSAIRV